MRRFCFVLLLFLLSCSFASAQTAPPDTTQQVIYQSARLVKMTASVDTQTHDTGRTTYLNTMIVSEKIVTYRFLIRSGGVEYLSKYTPKEQEQPGNMPDAWWQGNALVGIRVVKHKLYIRLTGGRELESRLIRQAPIAKAS